MRSNVELYTMIVLQLTKGGSLWLMLLQQLTRLGRVVKLKNEEA